MLDIKKFNSDPVGYYNSPEFMFIKNFVCCCGGGGDIHEDTELVAMLAFIESVFNKELYVGWNPQVYGKEIHRGLNLANLLTSRGCISTKGMALRMAALINLTKTGYNKLRKATRETIKQDFISDFVWLSEDLRTCSAQHMAKFLFFSAASWVCYYYDILDAEAHQKNLSLLIELIGSRDHQDYPAVSLNFLEIHKLSTVYSSYRIFSYGATKGLFGTDFATEKFSMGSIKTARLLKKARAKFKSTPQGAHLSKHFIEPMLGEEITTKEVAKTPRIQALQLSLSV
jgi:hypothetical protein